MEEEKDYRSWDEIVIKAYEEWKQELNPRKPCSCHNLFTCPYSIGGGID